MQFAFCRVIINERIHWSSDEDLKVELAAAAISRKQYDQIKQNLHFADNSKIDANDEMFKRRPLMNKFNQ